MNRDSYPTDEWLAQINERFRRENVHPASRPFLAWDTLSTELGVSLALGDPTVRRLFDWFRAHTQRGSQKLGPLFKGVHFYDAVFWPLIIWPFFGAVRLEPSKALEGMPHNLLGSLFRIQASRDEFIEVWCATMDFALSFGDLTEQVRKREALAFLRSAYRELSGTVSILLEQRPSAKAGHSAMFAVETIGKWFLSEHGRTTADLKGMGHDVVRIIGECAALLPQDALARWGEGIKILPLITDRYSPEEPPAHVLWSHYRTALFVGARLMRVKTGRDCLRNVSA